MPDKQLTWKDETGYSRGDRERMPRVWTLYLPIVTLSVHRHAHHEPDAWLFSCYQLELDNYRLKSREIEVAKAEAIACARSRCKAIMTSLEEAANA
jgi:hypothetical protein